MGHLSASIQEVREQYPERRENINALFGPLEELEQAGHGQQSFGRLPATFLFLYAGRPHRAEPLPLPPTLPPPFSCPALLPAPIFMTWIAIREELKHYSEAEVIFSVTFAIPNEGWHPRMQRLLHLLRLHRPFPRHGRRAVSDSGSCPQLSQLCRRADGAAAAHSGLHSGKCLLYEPLLNRFDRHTAR